MKKIKILFVCKYNRFRSKVAESFLAHFGSETFSVKSSGVMIDELRPYVSETTKIILREKGISVVSDKSHLINHELISWADKIVVVADNILTDIFPKSKLIVWKVHDASEHDELRVREIIGEIENLVKFFIEQFGGKARSRN